MDLLWQSVLALLVCFVLVAIFFFAALYAFEGYEALSRNRGAGSRSRQLQLKAEAAWRTALLFGSVFAVLVAVCVATDWHRFAQGVLVLSYLGIFVATVTSASLRTSYRKALQDEIGWKEVPL